MIMAEIDKIHTSAYGERLRIEYNELRDVLDSLYGKKGLEIDQVKDGSIWRNPNGFMMGLIQQERVLGKGWLKQHGSDLKPDLEKVQLYVAATSEQFGKLELQYTFTNNSQCEAEEKAAKKIGL